MKILLVDPPGKNKGLNTGLGYLSAVLKDKHEVKILDLNNTEIGICGDPNPDLPVNEIEKRVINAIEESKPDFFGISVKTFTADISKHMFSLIKPRWPEIRTIAGGPHITLDGLSFIKDNKIDFAIQGEGEFTIINLCSAIDGKGDFEKISGLIYWKDGEIIQNSGYDTIKDLDALPFPYYDNFSSVTDNDGHLPEYPILTSRGCPYKCTYCSMPKIMGSKWRFRSPERVINELKHAKQEYRSTSFAVVDDNFTLNLKRVDKICDLLISEQINLAWNSQNGIRADRIREDLANKMKQSGCRYVWIGIENADEEVFNEIHKGEKLEDIKTGIKYLKKAGIRVGGFFIVGLPYSTREADLKSVDFVKENGIDAWWFNFVPYPHTEASNWVQNHGEILRPIHGALQYGSDDIEPVFETKDYPKDIRVKTYNDIHIKMKYYDRLADPSLKQWNKWRRVFKKVLPNGFGAIIFLLLYVLKYNARLAIKKIKS